ncbi:CidA/LrgA family protein [Methylopila musalis]|uniref:CidA/LrgA family protein n=1 Tax=Methylopila musalis TaxID=1134781 RepID=A0ABW3Z7Y3_9HYPH
MTTARIAVPFRRRFHGSRVAQLALIAGLWVAGEGVTRLAGLPVPGGVVGLALALALLMSGRLSLFSLRRGANLLLADMLLFFVPLVVAVVEHRELAGLLGLKILVVILAGTAAVIGVTALTVELCFRLRSRHERVV